MPAAPGLVASVDVVLRLQDGRTIERRFDRVDEALLQFLAPFAG